MGQPPPFLALVWREACQHVELAEAALRIFPILAEHLPLARLAVREFDLERRTMETLVSVPAESTPPARGEVGASELDALLAWCRSGALEHAAAGVLARRLPGLLPPDTEGDVLVGPLLSP